MQKRCYRILIILVTIKDCKQWQIVRKMNEGGLDLFAGNKPYSHLTMRIDVTFVRPSRAINIGDVFATCKQVLRQLPCQLSNQIIRHEYSTEFEFAAFSKNVYVFFAILTKTYYSTCPQNQKLQLNCNKTIVCMHYVPNPLI